MFKKDGTAQFIRLQCVVKENLLNELLGRLRHEDSDLIVRVQKNNPVALRDGQRTLWLYQGDLYCEDNSTTSTHYGFWSSNSLIQVINSNEFTRVLDDQKIVPIAIGKKGQKTWWMFKEEFFCEDEGYTAQEILLGKTPKGREPIPDRIKIYVWNRDGGKCVRCGSQRNLEYDHIIPIAMGGSSTARNIQLLCQDCNRSKGGSLI
jgi:hypothetical protein